MIVFVRRASFACECTSLPEMLVPLPVVWVIVGSGPGLWGPGGNEARRAPMRLVGKATNTRADDGGTAFTEDVAAIVSTFSRAFVWRHDCVHNQRLGEPSPADQAAPPTRHEIVDSPVRRRGSFTPCAPN